MLSVRAFWVLPDFLSSILTIDIFGWLAALIIATALLSYLLDMLGVRR